MVYFGKNSKKIKARQFIKGEHREHVINSVMDVLRDWRSSPFENEGSLRAGLRSALCLEGHGWMRSDMEAERILAECFRIMGAKRPTWAQGQREYVEPRENCAWCSALLPEELQRGGSRSMYCSDVCARSAIERRTVAGKVNRDRAYTTAYDALRRLKSPIRQCSHCSRNFRSAHSSQHFCSTECRAASRIVVPMCTCNQCGVQFRPRMSSRMVAEGRGKFCSIECKAKHQREERFNRECIFCSASFVSSSRKAEYCSSSCKNASYRASQGIFPAKLNVRLFDYLFITCPQNARSSS